jgi:CMP-N,N'-diacetyllegionaminic acid synthase
MSNASTIAVILARSGSKRIPGKNLLRFFDQSLLQRQYSIASTSASIDHIVVFTDSRDYLSSMHKCPKYLEIGLRPAHLSGDLSTDFECFSYLASKLSEFSASPSLFVHLRPTYPCITVTDLDTTVGVMADSRWDSLKSIERSPFKIQKCFQLDGEHLVPISASFDSSSLPSQSCDSLYVQTAAIDIYRSTVISSGSLWGQAVYPYILGSVRCDIDLIGDLMHAYSEFDHIRARQQVLDNLHSDSPPYLGLRLVCDLDGVVFSRVVDGDYSSALPITPMVNTLLRLLDDGLTIVFHSARGSSTGIDWYPITRSHLDELGFSICPLFLGKPNGDFYLDDRSITLEQLLSLSSV